MTARAANPAALRHDPPAVGAWIPGIALRLALLLVVTATTFASGAGPIWHGIVIGAAVAAVLLPRAMTAWVAAALLAFGLLFLPPDLWRTSVTVCAVHAVHVLGSLSIVIPARSRIQLRALVPTATRFIAIQAVSQAVVLTTATVLSAPGSPTIPWLAPLGAAALLGVALLFLRGARRDRE